MPARSLPARIVRGVKNGPSPDWLQRRLKAIGLRPINALVDITNYIAYDRGRPLHVYDADKLKGSDPRAARHARARASRRSTARPTRSMPTCASSPTIAKVLGLGGVIGGEDTGSTDATTNVFIESAYFDPKRTARTGRRLDIQSDARFRFERGVDPDFVVPGLELATRMVLDICGGEPSKIEIAGKPPKPNAPFAFDPRLVRRAERPRAEGRRDRRAARRARHRARRQGAEAEGLAAVLAPRHFRARRSRRGGGAASSAWMKFRRRRCRAMSGVARPVLTEVQIAAAARAPRACLSRASSRP